ncbi:hydantoinase B/oxoprolinase family protein [Bradyrhizobium murdochi]|uniref:hydantoinase B/oxoprolinase family protein n=1 Tax=Bradyrhizobium murdochi TaxID=1038859 RepID=UPI000419F2B2|nr:hydantoinase B/oxoprolinase family protein [Bradyrhizobium murdochi]
MKVHSDFDPIELEILWNRLVSVVDEAAVALLRTAFSTVVRESNDFTMVLMDADGASIADTNVGTPSFVGILPRTLSQCLVKIPIEEWQPGDCIVTNDPWMTAGHLLDLAMLAPVFHHGQLVGFSGSIAHLPDIGGALFSADCQEVFEEGIRIPPTKFLEGGRENRDLAALIRANVRVPEQVLGDVYAQVTAHAVCARKLGEFLEASGLQDLTDLSAALQDRADKAMRFAIEAIPDGTYSSVLVADGYDDEETRIVCAVTVVGSKLHVDYTGSSKQIGRGLNSVMNFTYALSVYPLKCALDPTTPRNEGSYRSITVTAPEGSILNPIQPAACNARQLTGHLLAGAIYKCLAQIVPEKVIAESGTAPTLRSVYSGTDRCGNRFSQVLFGSGGMGASASSDGHSCTPFPTNTGSGSIEAFEAAAPLIVWRKELVPDSGGAGQFRGGLGQEIEVEVVSDRDVQLSLMADRQKNPPEGLIEGKAGAPVAIHLSDGSKPHPKSRSLLSPGQKLILRYAGAGGFGDPSKRRREDMLRDLMDGYVTASGLQRDYGAQLEGMGK